jgi:hypothetical protein
MIKAKPSSRSGLPTPQKASRAPHRKINQAQERQDAAASRPGARESDPAGEAVSTAPLTQTGRRRKRHPSTQCGFPPAGCPIAPDVHLVLDLSEDLAIAMRQLRRKLDACEKCPLDDYCGFRRAFQAQVDLAIQEVTGEWGMP